MTRVRTGLAILMIAVAFSGCRARNQAVETTASPVDQDAELTCVGSFDVNAEGFIQDWLIVGPYPNPGDRKTGCLGWPTDYLKPYGGEAGITPYEGMTVKFTFPEHDLWKVGVAEVEWTRHHTDRNVVNLTDLMIYEPLDLVFPPLSYVGAYAYCVVESPSRREVTLAVGADDDYKAYLNHRYVGGVRKWGACVPDQYRHKVTLKEGRNPLLIKCDNDLSAWKFCVRFLDADEAPVTDLSVCLPVR